MDGAIAPASHIAPSDWARLTGFRREVEAALPGRVRAVILFGSRARGDAAPDSDWDVAVFVAGLGKERTAVRHLLADLAWPHVVADFLLSTRALPDSYLDALSARPHLAAVIEREGVPIP